MIKEKAAIVLYNINVLGGIERMTFYVAKALSERNFDVDILACCVDEGVLSKLLDIIGNDKNMKVVKVLKLPSKIPVTVAQYVATPFFKKRIREGGYSITINMHGDIQPVETDIFYWHQFNVDYQFSQGWGLKRLTLTPQWWIRRRFIEKIREKNKLILVNSSWTLMEARNFWNLSNVRVLHPPVLVENLRKYAGRERGDRIATISRLTTDRGVENVLKLAKEIKHAEFILAGYVQDKKNFIKLMEKKGDNVIILPNISEDDKMEILAGSKVFFNPTDLIEGFGIAVAEGMSAGAIPVVRNSGGIIDFVPEKWRYSNLKEARILIEKALDEWSPDLSKYFSSLVDRFSFRNFSNQLFNYLSLK
jgi:glycosyltransferase involved in cell wall biosynthesis